MADLNELEQHAVLAWSSEDDRVALYINQNLEIRHRGASSNQAVPSPDCVCAAFLPDGDLVLAKERDGMRPELGPAFLRQLGSGHIGSG